MPRWPVLPALALVVALPALAVRAAAPTVDPARHAGTAAQVEAGYLLNFLRYCEWPATATGDAGEPLVIAVVGSDESVELVREAVAAAGPVAGRQVEVRAVDYRVRRAATSTSQQRALAQLRSSHLVFVDSSRHRQAKGVVRDLLGLPVLTVGNVEGFLDAGGMLELQSSGTDVMFTANAEAIQRSGLVLSARVLKLARPTGDAI